MAALVVERATLLLTKARVMFIVVRSILFSTLAPLYFISAVVLHVVKAVACVLCM